MAYNVFRYGAIVHLDPLRARLGGYPGYFDPEYDAIETRYAVCMYQGHTHGYEAPDGTLYESFKDVPYVTSESTARKQARRRWGYSKIIDSNNW